MAETSPEERLQHDVEEFDERLDKLGERIEEAERKAHPPGSEDAPGEEVVGDFHDTEGGPMFGEDPKGAAEEATNHREE